MKKTILIFAAAAVALLVVGTFFDLQITSVLYNPKSIFAKMFALLGMFPELVLSILAPAMALAVVFVQRRTIKIRSIVVIILALIVMMGSSYYDILEYIQEKINAPLAAIVSFVLLFIFLFFLASLPFAKKNTNEVFKVALIGLLALFFGRLILQILKNVMCRERFYCMDNPVLQFTKWYLPQKNPSLDAFKSFPSGHSFSGMLAVWFALFPRFITGLKKFTKPIFSLAVFFGLAVMFSRLVYGRHFLSDVTVGASLALGALCFAKYAVDKYGSKLP